MCVSGRVCDRVHTRCNRGKKNKTCKALNSAFVRDPLSAWATVGNAAIWCFLHSFRQSLGSTIVFPFLQHKTFLETERLPTFFS